MPEVGRPEGAFQSSSQIASSKSRPSLGLSFLLDQIRWLDEIPSQDRFKPQILKVFTIPHIKGGLLQVRKYVSMWEWGVGGRRGTWLSFQTFQILSVGKFLHISSNWLGVKSQESPELSNSFIEHILDMLF